jgi:hypothetical protein
MPAGGKRRNRKMRKLITLFAIAGMVLALAPAAQAADITWDGGGADQKWSTVLNWAGGVLPGAADTAVIAGVYSAVLDSNEGTITGLRVDAAATLTIKAGADLIVANWWLGSTSAATIIQEAGSIKSTSDCYFYNDGKYTVEGGILNMAADPHFYTGSTLKIIGDAATIIVGDDHKMEDATTNLELVLKGGGISTINVTGYVILKGTLDVSLDPSFVLPATNTDYDFLVKNPGQAGLGSFDTVNLPTDWSLTYVDGAKIVRLTYTGSGSASTPGTVIMFK